MTQPLPQPSTSVPSEILECNNQAITVFGNLQKFYKKCELYDVVLIAALDNFEIETHRVILSASSEYFSTMFRSTLKEAKAKEVKLEHIDGITLKLLIDFIYSASIELTSDRVENVLQAAHLYQLQNLIPLCCKFMEKHLDTTNCLGVAFFVEQFDCTTLHQKAFAFACKNFEKICTENEFFKLNEEQLKRLILSKDICARSKDVLLNSVVSWIGHDKANRETLAFSLMSLLCDIQLPRVCCKLSLNEISAQFCCQYCRTSSHIECKIYLYRHGKRDYICIKCGQ